MKFKLDLSYQVNLPKNEIWLSFIASVEETLKVLYIPTSDWTLFLETKNPYLTNPWRTLSKRVVQYGQRITYAVQFRFFNSQLQSLQSAFNCIEFELFFNFISSGF